MHGKEGEERQKETGASRPCQCRFFLSYSSSVLHSFPPGFFELLHSIIVSLPATCLYLSSWCHMTTSAGCSWLFHWRPKPPMWPTTQTRATWWSGTRYFFPTRTNGTTSYISRYTATIIHRIRRGYSIYTLFMWNDLLFPVPR